MTKIGLLNLAGLTQITTMVTLRGRENQQPVLIHPNATALILVPAGVDVPACALLIRVSSSPLRVLRGVSSLLGRSTQMEFLFL